jgi:hypothetical protein
MVLTGMRQVRQQSLVAHGILTVAVRGEQQLVGVLFMGLLYLYFSFSLLLLLYLRTALAPHRSRLPLTSGIRSLRGLIPPSPAHTKIKKIREK